MLATVLRDTQCTANVANNRIRHGQQVSLARADPDERFLTSRLLPSLGKYPTLEIISQVWDALRVLSADCENSRSVARGASESGAARRQLELPGHRWINDRV